MYIFSKLNKIVYYLIIIIIIIIIMGRWNKTVNIRWRNKQPSESNIILGLVGITAQGLLSGFVFIMSVVTSQS